MTDPGRTNRLALIAAGVSVVLWASAFVAIRHAAPHFSPGALALGRLLAGSVALGGLAMLRREGWPSRAAWPGIVVSGLIWFGLYSVALNWGEQTVDAGTASMIIGIGPIVIALAGGWLLKEGFPVRLLAALAVSFVGVVIVGLAMSDGGRSSLVGVLLCVVAALSFAGGVLSQKPALQHASALQVTAYGCIVATIALLPFGGQLVTQIADAPAIATLNVLYLGLFPTALAFATWAYALARTSAGKLGATTYAVPAVVILLSWLFLGEVPSLLAFLGGLLCVAGVALSHTRPRSPATPAAAPGPARADASAGPTERV